MSPYGLTPEEEQRIAAETIRSGQVLGAAAQRGSRFDNMAAISLLANNKAAAAAAGSAQTRALAGSKPTALGGRGFMVDGQFITDPGYTEEKMQGRAQQRGLALDKATAAAEQAEMNRQLRRDMASQAGALRMAIASQGAANKQDKANDKVAANVEKLIPQFGDRAQKLKLPRLMQSAQELEDVLDEADATGRDVDGIGYGSVALSKVPVLGEKVLGGKGMLNRANVQQLANALLAADSGMAVTLSEEQRATIASMLSGSYGEKETKAALRNIVLPLVNDVRANLMSSYPPEVIGEYNKRYGTAGGSRDWTKPLRLKGRNTASGKATDKSGPAAPTGVDPEDWAAMTPQERALWN